MTGLALGFALLLALAASAWRLQRRVRRTRRLRALPGGSAETALPVDSFDDIDEHVRHRDCLCGGALYGVGERSERSEATLLRVVHVECRRCEDRSWVYFDVSRVYH